MAANALTPLLSREQYRALYLENLSQEARVNARNLQANIDWAASGDAEQEAALNATVQGMPNAQVNAEVDQYIRALVTPRDVQFVLGRITLDQKKFILTNYAKIVGDMARLNIARPTSGPQFLAVLEANYLPVTTTNDAGLVASAASLYATRTMSVAPPQDSTPGITALQTPVIKLEEHHTASEDGPFDVQANLAKQDPAEIRARQSIQGFLKNKGKFTNMADVAQLAVMRKKLGDFQRKSSMANMPASGALDPDEENAVKAEHEAAVKAIRRTWQKDGAYADFGENDDLVRIYAKLHDEEKSQKRFGSYLHDKMKSPDVEALTHVALQRRNRAIQTGQSSFHFPSTAAGPTTGRGLGRRKSRKTATFMKGGGVAVAEGPPPAEFGWQQFGKYMLARNDLENGDIFHMRYHNGKPIQRMPRKMVGSGVKAVLSSIADGKHPKFDDIEALSSSERDYVRDIMKGAALDPSGFPEGDKSEKEKMKHKFDKLKGEIVAGNDNPEIVKDFKHIILKMRQAKMLPANQVNEILLELSTLGH